MMDFHVDYSSEGVNETGRTKLTVSDFDTTSIRDVKYAIQAAIQAPVCDQQLFYQGQPVTDNDMTLSRLYFREGDCFDVKFLAAANIKRMSELVDVLKNFARKIVEKFNGQPKLAAEHNSDGLSLQSYDELIAVIRELCYFSFMPWKQLRTVAQRHFFVQEGGFDAFLEVFKFSQRLTLVEDCIKKEDGVEAVMIPDRQLRDPFNVEQLVLQRHCLSFLWNFGETPQDRKFVLSQDVFPLAIDALSLQPQRQEDTGHIDINGEIVRLNETAIGCCGVLIEFDSNIQEEVSKMPSVIDKILFMIDRSQSAPAGYSLFSSQLGSNTLFYCTFNAKSAQPMVDCGALEKMLNITKNLLNHKHSNTLLRYYCCLFLARLRSAPLVKLDRDTCVAIDELIDVFLEQHVPNEISKWEERMAYVWITIVPLVHLAFAAGKEYYCSQVKVLECDTTQSEDAYFLKSKQSNAAITEYNKAEAGTSHSENRGEKREVVFLKSKQSEAFVTDMDEADKGDVKESKSSSYPLLNSNNRVESHGTSCKRRKIEGHTLFARSHSTEIATSVSEDKNCVTGNRKDQFTWPGSPSTQKLGIFSLMHMFSLEENQQLALAENLLPYLVCLSWHLKRDEEDKLRTSLANFHDDFSPPSLKVIAKSVLALVNGLDMVYKL